MKTGAMVWLKSDVINALYEYAESDNENVNDTLCRVLEISPSKEPKNSYIPRRLTRYDVSDLNVGDGKILSHEFTKTGEVRDNRNLFRAIRRYEEKTGRLFETNFTTGGITVLRIR